MKITVCHSYYGCETGCCGHVIESDEGVHTFDFDHPWGEDHLNWAKNWVREKFGEEHVADLDWENCQISTDC